MILNKITFQIKKMQKRLRCRICSARKVRKDTFFSCDTCRTSTGKRNLTNKLGRMALKLQEYDFKIEHIEGNSNVVADALLRICLIESFDWQSEQEKDSNIRDCIASNPDHFIKKGGILYRVNDGFSALCVPSIL